MNDLRVRVEKMVKEICIEAQNNKFISPIVFRQGIKLTEFITQQQEELVEKIKKEVMSGYGRETGVWHYEQNDINEYEASGFGDMLKIAEVSKYLISLKQDLTKKGKINES